MPGFWTAGAWRVTLSIVLLSSAARADRPAEEFRKHVVVAQEGLSADVGRDMLRAGGSAVDAAVATAFALAVTHPAAGNLGGGGFLVAFDADTHRVRTFDFRETAPRSATSTMYLGRDGKPVPRHRAGARAAGVPGTVRGLALAHSALGRRPWATLVRPAEALARGGFPVSETLARSLNAQLFRGHVDPSGNTPLASRDDLHSPGNRLADFPESVAVFRKPDGTPWKPGDLLRQPDLADTLGRIAANGPEEFYVGKTAERIVGYMESHNGLITREDLASYSAKERPPVHTTFRGNDVYGMGPVSSGGIVLAEMLGILETFDLKADGPRAPRTLHRVTEAQRRAYFTRATRIADPDFIDVPVAELVSKERARELALSITDRATPSIAFAPFPVIGAESMHTTHLSVLDASGSAVALTYTLEEGYGSKAVVEGAGFLLNNEMGDFNLIPGHTDTQGRIGTLPNQIAPGKRMLSSQCPTIVLRDGKVRLVTGSPGGRTIPNTVLWVVLNVLEFDLAPRLAVDAPRTHHAWFPDVVTLEGKHWETLTLDALRAMGHSLKFTDYQGDAHTIVVDPSTGQIHGIADTRRVTEKASGD
jgi:gamma-glutamyltranspeptidase / glutathione hydrolase